MTIPVCVRATWGIFRRSARRPAPRTPLAVQNLTVRAALEGRRDHVHHAAMLDRHAASVLSLDEIAEMVDELIDAHGDALPEGVRTSGAEAGQVIERRAIVLLAWFPSTLPSKAAAYNSGTRR